MVLRAALLEESEFGNVGREKPLGAKERSDNKHNPQMALIEHGPHWWEATALTTAPSSTVPCISFSLNPSTIDGCGEGA